MLLLFSTFGYCADSAVSETAESTEDRQLRINVNVLMQGPNQQTRDDAAIELLLSSNPGARESLISVLSSKDNPPALVAVCKSLIGSRTENKQVQNKADFIGPLMSILKSGKGKDAELAAEAMLIFEFDEVGAGLHELAQSKESTKQARLNAIYAISLRQADKNAIAELVELLGDSDTDVAVAASAALPYWVPKGMDRDEILRDLKGKSQEEIIRDRVVFLEEQIRKVSAEKSKWLKLYLGSLDKSFEVLDDADKGKMLLEHLKNPEAVLKVWSLRKLQAQSSNLEFADGFADSLVGLVADSDKEVRLSAANVLTKMSNLSSPEKLLKQLLAENNQDVRLAIFEALGEACYYALLASTPEKALSNEIRFATLDQADVYLKSDDPVKAKMGAVVIRKLIEPNGMDKEEVGRHLEKILARYNKSSGDLKADMLNVMSKIVGQSANRVGAGILYRQSFVDALNASGDNLLKQAAVTGLTNIDKADAIEEFVKMSLYDDSDSVVSSMIIQLAGEVGKSSDLEWLVNKIDSNGVGEMAWQSMRQILLRQNAEVIVGWADRLVDSKTNPERVRELIEIAEQKVAGHVDKTKILSKLNNELTPALFKVYLKGGDFARVSQVVSKRLQGITETDKVLAAIDGYLESVETKEEEKVALLDSLGAIKDVPSDGAEVWQTKLLQWKEKYLKKPEVPNEPAVEDGAEKKVEKESVESTQASS